MPRTVKRCPWDETYGCEFRDKGCEEEMCELMEEIKTPRYFATITEDNKLEIHSSEESVTE